MGHPKHGREIINTLLPETFVHLLVHFVQRDGGQVHGIQVMADGAFEERTAFADHFFAGYPIGKAFVTRDENLATTIFAVLVFGNDEQVIGVQYALMVHDASHEGNSSKRHREGSFGSPLYNQLQASKRRLQPTPPVGFLTLACFSGSTASVDTASMTDSTAISPLSSEIPMDLTRARFSTGSSTSITSEIVLSLLVTVRALSALTLVTCIDTTLFSS